MLCHESDHNLSNTFYFVKIERKILSLFVLPCLEIWVPALVYL